MQQLLTLCASIIEATDTPHLTSLSKSIWVESWMGKVVIDTNEAVLTVTIKRLKLTDYTETTVNLKQYTDRPPVEVIEELTQLACEEWKECKSEYLIDNKIKNLLNK